MKTWLALILLCLPLLAGASSPAIPEPPELEPDIRFWMRVYSEISTNEGFIHDQWNLGVVYETLHFDPGLAPRARSDLVEAARERYRSILRRLGSGAAPQDDDERRVLSLWGTADAQRLALAADDVRFQLGQADRFRAGLQRAGLWESHIAQTLAAQGLPPEIAALPHVESSFQPAAMSKAGAAGLWQFIRSTGRRFLRIDRAVDERLDPYRSTEAAAQLLAYNFRVLGTWPLAITAYNHGAAGMRRARDFCGTDDIVRIVRTYRSASFGFASRNYYASFVAALRLDRDPEKYFGALRRESSVATQEIAVPQATRADLLARSLGVDDATLRALNPALRPPVWERAQPVPRGYRLRLPAGLAAGSAATLVARLAAATGGSAAAAAAPAVAVEPVRVASAARPATPPNVEQGRGQPARAVRPAGRAGGGTGAVAQVAASSGPRTRGGLSRAEIAAAAAPAYTVHGGDTLAMIALQTGTDPELLMRLNGLRDGDHIYEGQRLALTAAAASPATLAADAQRVAQATEEERQDEAQAQVAAAHTGTIVNAAEAQAQGPTLLPEEGAPPSADPIDYSVGADGRLVVVAAETIGHYADWLGVSAASLRALNGMHRRSTVLIGMHFRLAFTHVTREQFERRRRDYHQQLQTEFFASHRIIGTDAYVARRGDSLWSVTQRGALPVWLLQQYNPDVDFAELRPGTQIVLPRVEAIS